MILIEQMQQELQELEAKSNLRKLPGILHEGRDVIVNGQRMLNLSSNDYLGLANDIELRRDFLETLTPETFLTSADGKLHSLRTVGATTRYGFRYGSGTGIQQRIPCQYGYPSGCKQCPDTDFGR